ncbi:MAG: alpha/beta hydrolase [Acidobacteria bacterium]|nr:alpha/beta hydrolase [Acidobacteriota bacterium]
MAPLHPVLAPLVEWARNNPSPHPRELGYAQVRDQHLATSLATEASPPAVAEVWDTTLPTRDGAIQVRVYKPLEPTSSAIGIYCHGGGFVMGTLDSYDGLARRLAVACGLTLVSVDYRLAPEHPFPAGLHDVLDVTTHIAHHPESVNAAPGPLVLFGDSAGGCLVAVAAQELAGHCDIAAQVLMYPTLGPEILTESAHRFGTGYFLELDHLTYHYSQYLGSASHADPRVSPLLANDLTGVAPAVIVVAEFDPLRDEAVHYAGLLTHFGVDVELWEAEGMVHSFLKLGGLVPEALEELHDLGRHVREFVTRHL